MSELQNLSGAVKLNFILSQWWKIAFLDPQQQQTYYGGQQQPPQQGYPTQQQAYYPPPQQQQVYNPPQQQMNMQQPPYADPEDPEAKGFEFNDQSIRKGFIRKVFAILTVSYWNIDSINFFISKLIIII